MSILIAVTEWDPETWARPLAERLPERDIRCFPDIGEAEEIHYVLVWKPEPGLLKSLPHLKIIFSLGAGVDHILLRDPELPDVPIVRIVDPDLTMRMGEYVVLHVLLHHRQHLYYQDLQRQRRWKELRQPVASAVRVGIMGLGELGRDAAGKLLRLGFDVAGWSSTPKTLEGVACFAGQAELDAFLARTDILVCLLPLTPATRGILNRRLFSELRRDGPLGGAVLINAGRGELQVGADIVAALDAGDLQAASLDVFETEPLPADSPLWELDNVIITPKVGGMTDVYVEQTAPIVGHNLRAYREGRLSDLLNVVPNEAPAKKLKEKRQ